MKWEALRTLAYGGSGSKVKTTLGFGRLFGCSFGILMAVLTACADMHPTCWVFGLRWGLRDSMDHGDSWSSLFASKNSCSLFAASSSMTACSCIVRLPHFRHEKHKCRMKKIFLKVPPSLPEVETLSLPRNPRPTLEVLEATPPDAGPQLDSSRSDGCGFCLVSKPRE